MPPNSRCWTGRWTRPPRAQRLLTVRRLTSCRRSPSSNQPFFLRSHLMQPSFSTVLWILFVTTGLFTLVITMAIRLFFRHGKSVTDL
jgi:hypothetical protein